MGMNADTSGLLLERSLADLLVSIEADAELSPSTKAQLLCSVRRIAEFLGKIPAELPARWTAIRWAVGALHHAQFNIEAKTLANYRAYLRAALAWFCKAEKVPRRGVPLSPVWKTLSDAIDTGLHRKRLLSFMRFCSARGIEPKAVTEKVVDEFLAYRAEHTRLTVGIAMRRALARSWNGCRDSVPGWPQVHLVEPALKQKSLQLDDLPPGLREDLDAYLASLARVRRNGRNKRMRPNKPSTIATRRREIMAFISKAGECGFALETLTSFKALLRLNVIETVLDAYWAKNGAVPTVYTIDLAWKILDIASHGALTPDELEYLDDTRAELDEYRSAELTEKNRAVIRQVLVPGVWQSVMRLPERLMEQAERQRSHAPVRAAVLAGVAVAIQLLIYAPVRIGNLASVRIGENLICPGGLNGPYWLVFPDYEVKNHTPLEYGLTDDTTAMIDRYLKAFRPVLMRGHPSDWLFPGETGNDKGASTLSEQITDWVHKETGVQLTAHQFRHAAAAIFLKHRPGEYELVRRLLGHKSVQTTIRFYAGLETTQANQMFAEIVQADLKRSLSQPVHSASRGSRGRTEATWRLL